MVRILRFFVKLLPYLGSEAEWILAMSKGKKKRANHKMNKGLGRIFFFERDRSKKSRLLTQCNCPNNIFIPSSKAIIYASELDYIAKCMQDYPNIETGGQLYGAWTASGAPRVLYSIGPGSRANHEGAFFNQDIAYLEAVGAKLKQYGLQHIGEWHSHHHLGIPRPSRHDASTMQNGIDQLDLHRLLLCIGSFNNRDEIIINPFNFARDAQYNEARWEVINADNRLRRIIDADLRELLVHPQSTSYIFAEPYISASIQPVSNNTGWFSIKENRMALKQIIDNLKRQGWAKEVIPQISSDGIVSLKVRSSRFAEVILFPNDFPNSPFNIEYMNLIEGDCHHYVPQNWNVVENDLLQTFITNYNHLRNSHT